MPRHGRRVRGVLLPMSQKERVFKQHIDNFMEEQRRLHKEVMSACVDTRVAAAEAKGAAERIEKSSEDLGKWTLSVQRRVEKLERWQYLMTGGAIVAGAALWEKAKKVLGLS